MTIYGWSSLDHKGPFQRNNNQWYIPADKYVKKTDSSPAGASGAKQTYCYLNNQPGQFLVKKGDYWGLITSDQVNWTIVRLWEVAIGESFYGYPQKTARGATNSGVKCAAYTFGHSRDFYGTKNGKEGLILPLFYKYPASGDYREILSTNEMLQYYNGANSGRSWSGSPGGSNPNPPNSGGTTPPTQGQLPTGPPPTTGGDSGTGSTIGTTSPFPDFSGLIPDLSGFIGYPGPPSTNSGGGNKDKGGQWVTGADGKQYYLPPGLDFSGFKQPPPQPKPETKIVVRMPSGYAPPHPTAGTKPRMTQRQLDLTDSGQAIGTVIETFVFPYTPQNIRYSDMGSVWQEIPRAMNTSFVDWSGYKLMKVSMDFLVAGQYTPSIKDKYGKIITQGTAVSDGLMNSVANELNMLRRMATNKFPVTLEGFDDILQVQMARSRFEQPRGIQFVIQDLNIVAGRRTVDEKTGLATNPSNISAAQVSLTLQEIPVETVTVVKLPPLQLGAPIIGKGGGGGGGGVDNLGLQSGTLIAPWLLTTPTPDPNG